MYVTQSRVKINGAKSLFRGWLKTLAFEGEEKIKLVAMRRYNLGAHAKNLSSGFISLILRDFSLSFGAFYLEKGTLVLPFDKNLKNLRELSYENMQNNTIRENKVHFLPKRTS